MEEEDEDVDVDEIGRRIEVGEVKVIGCECDCLEEDCRFDRCLAFVV